ncbi:MULTISPECIES: hypothetical protein [Paenibacillus]|uniref:hypothetical protein n=1 Tax=Paenibacillus TaxID=44249 RepID=UPI0011DD97DC|nr:MULTISPECIES: hypothetical protein [Paenibacillus]MDU4698414.1 hypothetical protein [Paenibacillus sp.]
MYYFRPYATGITQLQEFEFSKVGYVKIHHRDLGDLIGMIHAAHDVGDPLKDFVEMSYYDPKTGQFIQRTPLSAQDLSAPQIYSGPIPPVIQGAQPSPSPGTPPSGRWQYTPQYGWVWVPAPRVNWYY